VAFVTHRPAEPLSRFVDYLWWLRDVPAHPQERIVPTGTHELVINLDADAFDIRRAGDDGDATRFSGAMVSGAYSKHFIIDTRAHANLFGVHFKPGAAGPILGVPPGELADQHVDLDLLWGRLARGLRDRLGSAATTANRFQIMESELLGRLGHTRRTHPAVALALRRLAHQQHTIEAITHELGFSRRRFIELFTAEVGMTPKLYGRVQRFQGALARAQRTRPDWAELALQAGYCDQSHLIRDFVTFSGFSPSQLLRHTVPQLKDHHLRHG
jgi:AraC-like DNA-binding protein